MAKIKTLKDYEDNIVYPRSITSAIVDSEGIDLNAIHAKFVKAEKLKEIEEVIITYETTQNKVTSIDGNSTDIQYPSAKAVYDAILELKTMGIKIEKVSTRPDIGDPTVIYLVLNQENQDENYYDEWIYIENHGWEKIGSTKIDLTNYVQISDLNSVAFSGEYNDLNNLPEIPSATSELLNDSNFKSITASTVDLTAGTSTLATDHIYLVYE